MSSDYLLVLPLEKIALGNTYGEATELPLHCTVMHWFPLAREYALGLLSSRIEGLAREAKIREVELISLSRAYFGPKSDIPVHVLDRNERLITLHRGIFMLLAQGNSLPEDIIFIGERYRPHVTDTKRKQFLPGSGAYVRHLVVIERNESKMKRICRIITLS